MLLRKILKENGKQNINSRKYGQVKLRASRRGIYACLFALVSVLMQLMLIYVAYRTYGETSPVIGSLGLIAFIVACAGVGYGINGFRERERNYSTCKLGIVLNGLIIIGFIFLFIRGLI